MNDQATALRNLVQNLKDKQRGMRELRIVTVTSGKGGVGKTVFTVNLAIALQKMGHRVLVIDSDFGLSNVDVVLGVMPEFNLSHVVRGEKTIMQVVEEGPYGLKFISGGSGVFDLLSLGEADLGKIVTELLRLEDIADIILFDTSAGISPHVLSIIASSMETIVVTTPEPTSIMDAYALIKTAAKYSGTGRLRLVMNRAETISEAETTLGRVCDIVEQYLDIDMDRLGYVLFDSTVPKAVKQQSPIVVSYPKSVAAKNIEAIARKFADAPEEAQSATGLRAFFRNLLGQKKTV
ncbi:MinD/ParA family protein [Oscillospiraceae bacterium OttesenSCG-928-F05]|nr:MinD/ParA family protein [Oscillospiraceae bacterium OttesenSCG-928-F05]